MTGTGTENDPYIVSNWTDFITAVGTANAYIEFPKNLVQTQDTTVNPDKLYTDSNGNVKPFPTDSDLPNLYENTFCLDANDYAPEGFTASITTDFKSLKGFGGTIKNIYSNGIPVFKYSSNKSVWYGLIEGIAYLNSFIMNSNLIWTENNIGFETYTFKLCKFSGKFIETNGSSYYATYVFRGFNRFQQSSFTLDMSGVYFVSYPYSSLFDRCRFNFLDFNGASGSPMYLKLANCYVSGQGTGSYAQITVVDGSSYVILDIDVPTISSSSSSSCIVINSDKYSGTVPDSAISATTAQIRSTSYLSSIGFTVQT
jgi:hypothetical protein